jgi:hypothetical protein
MLTSIDKAGDHRKRYREGVTADLPPNAEAIETTLR